jgi:hypothetical protein
MIHTNHADTPGSRDCGRFFLDVVGRFAPEQMDVRWTPQQRVSNDEVDELIEQTWHREKTRADESQRRLFNGKLCRLVQACPSPDQLSLTLGDVTYKEFVGTNLTNAYLRHLHGPDVLADALGVSAAVVSADGYLVLGRRSAKVAYHGGRIHPIGGIVEPAEAGSDTPHPAGTMVDELREELDILPGQIDGIECIGLVRDKHIVQPELVFDVTVSTDVAAMVAGAREAKDAMEHIELVPVRHHPASVVTFMENNASQLTPVALATLLLHGLHAWGSGWFASTRGYLRSSF